MTVSIDGVSKYFLKQTGTVQVLENINFQLEKGDFVTVIVSRVGAEKVHY